MLKQITVYWMLSRKWYK